MRCLAAQASAFKQAAAPYLAEQEEVDHAHDVVPVRGVASAVQQLQQANFDAGLVVVRHLVFDHLHGHRAPQLLAPAADNLPERALGGGECGAKT